MSDFEPRTLRGFRDYLPDVMVPREAMLQTVATVFRSFGFQPIATPALEYTGVLLGKYGDEGDKLLYRFRDNGDRDVSLRYDLTVPLARVIAQHGAAIARPFKRFQMAPVWRAENPARGRFREFMQCDVDIVGAEGLLADFECIQVGAAVLRALGVERFVLRINDRRILDGLMRRLGITEPSQQTDVLRIVDKLPKIGWDAMMAELRAKVALPDQGEAALRRFLEGGLAALDESVVDLSVAQPGIDSLNQLLAYAEALGIRGYLDVDLSIARGLDYYTSTIYETFLLDLPTLGSVMSGGRYDKLLGMFTGESIPAVGISLGVDRLLAGLTELGLVPAGAGAPDVFLVIVEAAETAYALGVARDLRAAGLTVQTSLEPGAKMGKQFKLAARTGATAAVVIGSTEAATGSLTVKLLATGEQTSLRVDEIPARVKPA
ncbi:MAG: histidine--tRNA ligase [Myxococcales bacterium]|nr:histidine--tRNA ligase [Myxococcales bacterium]